MNAREQKIYLLVFQRRFLDELIVESTEKSKDGDPSLRYVGYIYPENLKYLKEQGYEVTSIKNESLTANVGGRSVYMIKPMEIYGNILISQEEIKESEHYADLLEKKNEENFLNFPLSSIISGIMGEIPNEQDESKDCSPKEAPEE